MRNAKSLGFAVGLIAAAIAPDIVVANPRTSGAYNLFRSGAYGPSATNINCVTETWGGTINVCSATQTEIFETIVDVSGLKKVNVRVFAPGTAVSCYSQTLDTDVIDHRIDGAAVTSGTTGYFTLNLPALSVPVGWNLRVICSVPKRGVVLALNWNV